MKSIWMAQKLFKTKITPLKITLIYVAVGILWILFSDKLLAMWVRNPDALLRIATLKAWCYVLVTAGVLYALTHRGFGMLERTEQSLRKANRALRALSKGNRAIIGAKVESKLMQRLCRIIVEVGGYRMAWVGMAQDNPEQSVHPAAHWGVEGDYLESLNSTWSDTEKGRGPAGTAIRTGAGCVCQNILTDPHFAPWRRQALEQGYGSAIALPLKMDEKAFGALSICAAEPDAFDPEEARLLEELAVDLSFGISTLRLRGERNRISKERTQLATMVEQAEEGMLLLDTAGAIQYMNPAFERISGHWQPDIQGQNIRALTGDEPNGAYWKTVADALDGGELKINRFTNRKKDGTAYEVDTSISAIRNSAGAIINHMVVIRDVTHEAQLERQLRQAQKMEVVGTLSGGIAHDFNNILGAILNCSELALEDLPVGSPVREDLEHVRKAAYRGKNLVKQIRSFSHPDDLQRLPVQIDLIVKECLSLLRASLPADIEIHPSLAVESSLVLADANQIHQVLMNLCTNASNAMGDAGGILGVSLTNALFGPDATPIHPDLRPGSYLKLTVSDTGHGMGPEVVEQIFDPFFTTHAKSGGTGLGLPVVHGIVKGHDGAITVESEPGKGSTFNVFLPLADNTGSLTANAAADRVGGGSERILLVDDENDLIYAGQKMLQRLGYTVVACTEGLEALEAFRAAPYRFDLVITDQTMPQMKGTDLAKEILQIRSDIPIILCSGYGSASDHMITPEYAKSVGIREFVAKPVTKSEMARAIRRELDTP